MAVLAATGAGPATGLRHGPEVQAVKPGAAAAAGARKLSDGLTLQRIGGQSMGISGTPGLESFEFQMFRIQEAKTDGTSNYYFWPADAALAAGHMLSVTAAARTTAQAQDKYSPGQVYGSLRRTPAIVPSRTPLPHTCWEARTARPGRPICS